RPVCLTTTNGSDFGATVESGIDSTGRQITCAVCGQYGRPLHGDVLHRAAGNGLGREKSFRSGLRKVVRRHSGQLVVAAVIRIRSWWISPVTACTPLKIR